MTGHFSEADRREIAGRARTLHERLDGPSNERGGDPTFDPDAVLDEWRDLFPDESAFADRLERGGLSEAEIREQVAATRWPADEPLPEWINELAALVEYVETTDPDGGPVAVGDVPDDDDRPAISGDVPFAALVARIAGYAYERLPGPVPADAVDPMVEWFGRRCRVLVTRALYVEFKSFVSHHDLDLARADPGEFEDPPTELYEAFVDAMVDGGFRNLCLEYPVLARQLVEVTNQWIDALAELARRIEADRAALAERFGVDGAVTSLDPLANDTHARGRLPVRVDFESGEVIYKPRPVDAGKALYGILDRLEDHLPRSSVRTPRYLLREGYGWMEPVEYRSPGDEAAVRRYYEQAGMLVCAAYALGLTDCQFENVIVDGERPTILDAETAFHAYLAPSVRTMPAGVAEWSGHTVLSTSMLPWTIGDPTGPDVEDERAPVAAFGDDSGELELSGFPRPSVEAVNTDVMSVESEAPTIDRTANTPTVDGEDRLPGEYVDEMVRGFERTYETVRRLRDEGRFRSEIVDEQLPDGIETRLVYRGTYRYASVLRSAAARDPLRDGTRLTVAFERLAVPFFDGRIESDRCWPLYAAERRSLRRRDVPRFITTPTGTAVFHDGAPVECAVDSSGYERSRQRLDAMGDADRSRQVWLLERCFRSFDLAGSGAEPTEPSDERLSAAAADLGEDVIDAAVDTPAGRRWVSFESSGGDSTLTMLPSGSTLYNGRGGIGLAFAALAEATDRDRFHRYAVEALDGVVDEVRDGGPQSLGGTAGLGSVVYVLSVTADLLDVPEYRRVAADVAGEVTDELLAADDTFDVMAGSAGTLLALLAHHDRYGGPDVLDRAVACGERLLDARVEVDGYRVWRTLDDDPLVGFAHGSSGIAYALARLAATVDDSRYEAAVREALDFESAQYSPERDNWLNPTWDVAEADVDRWCYGRTGVALARLGIGTHLGDESLIEGATEVLAVTEAAGLGPLDTVCCGNVGRAEAMLEAARRRGAPSTDARAFAGGCLARAEREGSLSIPGHAEAVTDPTFFDGVAGVAYTLLRLRNPDDLPCVLLLE